MRIYFQELAQEQTVPIDVGRCRRLHRSLTGTRLSAVHLSGQRLSSPGEFSLNMLFGRARRFYPPNPNAGGRWIILFTPATRT